MVLNKWFFDINIHWLINVIFELFELFKLIKKINISVLEINIGKYYHILIKMVEN